MRDALAQKTQLFLARTQANVDRDLAQPPEQVIEPVLPGIGHRDDHGIERLEACARNPLVEIAVAVPAPRREAARLRGIGQDARDPDARHRLAREIAGAALAERAGAPEGHAA